MNEQVVARHSSLHSSSENGKSSESSEFVIVGENGESPMMQPLEDSNLDERTPPIETSGGKIPREKAVTNETPTRTTSIERRENDPGLTSCTRRQSTQTERRWRIERSNALSEEKLISLDRLQSRLSAILGMRREVERSEKPTQIKVYRSLKDASPESTEVSPEPMDPPESATTNENGGGRKRSFHEKSRISAEALKSVSYVDFGRLDADNGEAEDFETSYYTYPEKDSTRNHRPLQNEYGQNLCGVCRIPVSANPSYTVELCEHSYHKRCLVDLYFTQEDLFLALRARCREHARKSQPKKNRSVWGRITRKLGKLFKRK